MQYGELVTRAFSIVWRFKYLWLLAILGGADVGTGGFGGSFGNLGSGTGRPGGPGGGSASGQGPGSAALGDASRFVQDFAGLLILGVVLLVVLALAWFVLSCVTTGALVRASAEHDAERTFGLGLAWRTGLGTFWSILGLRLLGLLWALLVVAVIGLFVVLGVVSYANGQQGALTSVIAFGLLVGLVLVVASIVVGLAFILATRAVVLEQRGAVAALGRGFQLLRARLGRVLLVWLIQVGLALGGGLAIAIVLIPVFLLGAALVIAGAVAGGAATAVLVAIPLALVVLALLVVVSGAVGAYLSTYWTLAFRRLELEAPRPVAWPEAAYPPQQPAG